jgi:uncharacterized phage-associated protein
MNHPRYREDKATQAAARLLQFRGGRMSHLKLIKLLYIVERESLIRFGVPVMYDSYASLPYGPIPSATLDRINEPEFYSDGYWNRHIAPKVNNEVSLRESTTVPNDQLSRVEESLIDEVYSTYGNLTRCELVDLTHTFPEYQDPQGSSIPIDPSDILRAEGYSDEEIGEIRSVWEEAAYARELFT